MDGRDLAHDALHVARVYRWALRLAPEAGADPDLAGAAALVHDLDRHPSTIRRVPRLASAPRAPPSRCWPRPATRRTSARRSSPPSPPRAGRAVSPRPHDRRGTAGRRPPRRDRRGRHRAPCSPATNRWPRPGVTASSITGRSVRGRRPLAGRPPPRAGSLRVKLLKLADGMHTPTARAEAARRHEAMLSFLSQLWGRSGRRVSVPTGPLPDLERQLGGDRRCRRGDRVQDRGGLARLHPQQHLDHDLRSLV